MTDSVYLKFNQNYKDKNPPHFNDFKKPCLTYAIHKEKTRVR